MNYKHTRQSSQLSRGTGILPKTLFVGFTLLGAISISIIKGFNFYPLLGIIIPVALIVTYCALAANVRLFYIREDQIGDNAYYMGFLFTLSSLSVALIKLQQDATNLEAIIGSFGTALWSTIAGIALRVFFAQIRQDPNDIEKDSRARIAETASLLTSQLHQATVSFNNYTRGLQQSVEESLNQVGSTVGQTLTENIGMFSDMTKYVVNELNSVVGDFGTHAKKINVVSEKIVIALEALNERITNIEAPESTVTNAVKEVFSNAEDAGKKFTKIIEKQATAFENATVGSSLLLETVTALSNQVSAIEKHSTAFNYGADNVDTLIGKLNDLIYPVTMLAETFAILSQKHIEAIDTISKHGQELQGQLEKSRSYTDETHNSLVSMTRTLAEKLQ